MTVGPTLRVCTVQATPAYLDRAATLAIVAEHIAEAAADAVDLIVFPESFVPGYPDFVWRQDPWTDKGWYARLASQAIDVSSDALDGARAAAETAGIWVALGITERVDSGTLYNSVVYINREGEIAGVHRKLIPTGPERMVWANGQGPVLTVVEIDGFKVGSLICWENYMPLARAALYEQGVDILLAPTWDNSDEWVGTLRHIAKEGRVFVVGATAFIRGSDVPRDLPRASELYGGDEDLMSQGNSTIVAPGGKVLEGPLVGKAGTLTATLEHERITAGRRHFDPTGHYARPDILSLTINTNGERK